MPIITGVKYACEPCVRGHRSSKCTHEDRLLVQVRKPGRPLSLCPHLPAGNGGTTTFVDANGAKLDDTTPTHDHGAGGKPCGCGVTSLAIPKVAACACSIPRFSSSTTKPTSKSSPFELRIYPHKHFKTRVSSPPISPTAVTSDSSSGRISKTTKKRKSISVSGEAILQIAGREALLKPAGQQDAIENRTATEGTTDSLGYAGEGIYLTDAQSRNGHAYISTEPESDIRQFQSKGAITYHDSSNAIFNNTAFWGQDNWRPETGAPIPRQPVAEPETLPQSKPCCNGCGSKLAQLVPTVAHNHQLMNQAQFQAPVPCGLPPGPSPHPMFHESMQHMQPIATTIYTYPNGYTTVNNPLTPQELRMLQTRGAWAPSASAAWPGLGVGVTGNSMDAEYACSCGPGCECLGCAAHPFNTSTVNFVKDMRTMMYSSRHGVPPRRQSAVAEHSAGINGAARQTSGCCGGGVQQRDNMVMPNTVSHSHPDPSSPPVSMNYGVVHNHQGFEHMHSPHLPPPPPHHHHHHQYISSPHPLQQVENIDIGSPQPNDIPISTPPLSQHSVYPLTNRSPTSQHTVRPHHCRPTAPLSVSSPPYTSGLSPDLTSGGDDTEPEQTTVSPSAYFHINYPLGLFSESDMGCLCGDDCACIDCMLHGNNMPDIGTTLNEPIEPEAPTILNLTSGSVSTASRGCCGGGGRINLNSGNGLEAGLVGDPQGRGLSNEATNHSPQH